MKLLWRKSCLPPQECWRREQGDYKRRKLQQHKTTSSPVPALEPGFWKVIHRFLCLFNLISFPNSWNSFLFGVYCFSAPPTSWHLFVFEKSVWSFCRWENWKLPVMRRELCTWTQNTSTSCRPRKRFVQNYYSITCPDWLIIGLLWTRKLASI